MSRPCSKALLGGILAAAMACFGCTANIEEEQPTSKTGPVLTIDGRECSKMLHIQPGFTEEELSSINQANDAWNSVAKDKWCTSHTDGYQGSIQVVKFFFDSDWYKIRRDVYKHEFWGLYSEDPENGIFTIWIGYPLAKDDVRMVTLHEIGHGRLGPEHYPSGVAACGIMNVSDCRSSTLTDYDISVCRAKNVCN